MRARIVFAVLGALFLIGAGHGEEAGKAVCHCGEGHACWRYLRSPEDPPDDPCWCDHCREVARHDGREPWPEEWVDVKLQDREARRDAFLRRHAASWNMVCSVCDKTRVPGVENPAEYPFTPESGRRWNPAALEQIRRLVEVEKKVFAYTPVVIETEHFHLVTDIPDLRVQVQGRNRNTTRLVETHELAHIYAERLEKGYREFCEAFGPPRLRRPVGVYMPESSAVARVIQETYFGHPDTTILLGGGARSVSDGHCMCGFTVGLHRQKLPSNPRNERFAIEWRRGRKAAPPGHFVRLMDDDQVHIRLRHLLGHTLLAAWPTVRVKAENLPPWLYAGVGHWLGKSHPRLRELATFCGEECKPLEDPGKKWDARARAMARSAKRAPAEEMCAANTLPELNRLDLHLRAWSWFDTFIARDRERFVEFVRLLRDARPAGEAASAAMGGSLEDVDRRWSDLVLRRAPEDEPDEDEAADEEVQDARRAVAALNEAKEPIRKAALVRNLPPAAIREAPGDVLALLGHRSAHVRETTVIRLQKSTDPAVAELLRTHALEIGSDVALANVVRLLGLRYEKEAADAVLPLLSHDHWLVRSNAARTLTRLGDERAGEAILARLRRETAPRAKIAFFDALALSMPGSERPVMDIVPDLGAADWQVRVAAARAIGRLGGVVAVPDLIARMEQDGGRVREECYEALKRITRDDLGRNPQHWREWWNARRSRPVQPPPPPREEPAGPPEDHPTGTIDPEDPTYYGIRVVSDRVGYVLDVSQSMTTVFRPIESLQKRLRRSEAARPRIEFARDELIDSVARLDPRSSFNIWTFHDVVEAWKPTPQVANATNKARAASHVRNIQTGESTNYYDTFREIFGLPELGRPAAGFRPTPDTVFFLTDGEPTVGDITDADEFLAWFEEENRFARLRVHVIAFGDKNLNFDLLTAIARGQGGTILHLRER